MNKVKRFSLEERYGYQNRKVIYDKNTDNDIELNNIYLIIDLFNQLDEQIADLQHRLEEKEKSLEYFRDIDEKASKEIEDNYKQYNQLVNEYNELITELKFQPAEIVRKIRNFCLANQIYLRDDDGQTIYSFLDNVLIEYKNDNGILSDKIKNSEII